MSADCATRRRSFLKSLNSVSCYGATALGRNSCSSEEEGMCGQQCFRLPSFLPPLCSLGSRTGRSAPPRRTPARYRTGRALALLPGFSFLRRHRRLARCEKNGGAKNILILQTGRIAPSPNPEGFAAQEFGRGGGWRRQTKRKKQHQCSISGFPSSPYLKTGRDLDEFQAVPLPSRFPRAEVFLCVRRESVCDYFPV